MRVEFCKKSVQRLATDVAPFVEALREREHVPVVKDCLNRCQRCDLGFVMATADGTPLSASTLEQLLGDLDALAADDL
ncbi:MAG TPA: hypothetical protein VGP07_12895 [Polyangia bacterium]|jgi:hypothetical protein